MKSSYDTVIVGSGFGGSVMACRLARSRREEGERPSICVLERGRRYNMGEFPRDIWRVRDWWWYGQGRGGWNGLWEYRDLGDMGVGMAAGVGGTSLVYLDVQIDAFDTTWDFVGPEGKHRWPRSVAWRSEMPQYYTRVEQMLRPSPIPCAPLKARALQQGAQSVGDGDRFRLLDLAVYWGRRGVWDPDPYDRGGPPQVGCDLCGECYIGCNSHSKNTVDLNYLWMAQQAGAEVYSLHNVLNIKPNGPDHPQRPGGFTVHFEDLRWGLPGSVAADRVVLAAGTIGSTELLLRCKHGRQQVSQPAPTLPEVSDMLGSHFSGNGDFGAVGFETDRTVEPMDGPSITGVLDYEDRRDGHGFLIEEGGCPDMLRAQLRQMPGGLALGRGIIRGLSRALGREPGPDLVRDIFRRLDFEAARDALPMLIMGSDASDGEMSLDRNGNLKIGWNTERNMDFFREVENTVRDILQKEKPGLNGNMFLNPTWTTGKHLITVHPLGGCPMGDDPARGVVDPRGEVYNYPGLYVADGSIVPSALGANPSKTIGALAERIAEKMTEE